MFIVSIVLLHLCRLANLAKKELMKLTYHEKPNVDDIMNLIHDLDQALLDAKAVDLESVNDILMRD